MKTITRRSFLATAASGALAISCLGLTGCGFDSSIDEGAANNESNSSLEAENIVSPIQGVEADWNVPGYYEYQNDDPSSPFQKFTLTVGNYDVMKKLGVLLQVLGGAKETDISLSIQPYMNPELYELYKDDNPGIYNEDKTIQGNLAAYFTLGSTDEQKTETENELKNIYGDKSLETIINNVDRQELVDYFVEKGLLRMRCDAKDRVMVNDEYVYTDFILDFPITDLNDCTHLTLTNAFCFDEAKELVEVFSFNMEHEGILKAYKLQAEANYKEPIHFTCVSFKPMNIKTDEEKAQEQKEEAQLLSNRDFEAPPAP